MMKRYLIPLCTIGCLCQFTVRSTSAIPLFARKYSVTCFTCHVSPPLLNDFGRRFQANGYNLPGSGSDMQAQHDQPAIPIALLSQPMVMHTIAINHLNTTTKTVTSFSGLELGLFSSASLGPHFSFFFEAPILLENGETSIELLTAQVLYTDVLNNSLGNLNLRFGKMRSFVPFIANTLFSNSDPLIYSYSPADGGRKVTNSLNVFEPAFGVSAFGILPQLADGLRWEVGLSGGTSNNIDFTSGNAGFFALNQTLYVQNAPLRLGAFFYYGKQQMFLPKDSDRWFNNTSRLGIDLELHDPWTKRFNLYGQLLLAKDNFIDDHGNKRNMKGGFIGLNIILMAEKLYAFGRYDYLHVTETETTQNQIDIGLRWNLLPNVILTTGLASLSEKTPDQIDRTTLSLLAGILFGF